MEKEKRNKHNLGKIILLLLILLLLIGGYFIDLFVWTLIEDPGPSMADITQNQKQIIEEYNKEEKELRELIKLNPNDTEAHYSLGVVLYNLERFEEAENEFRKVIRLNPDNVEAHYSLGVILYNLEQFEEAKKEFKEAIKIHQNRTCFK